MADPQENKDHKTTQGHAADKSSAASEHKTAPEPFKPQKVTEHGGPKGLEPTRYGDWEKNGRCTDF